jgi:hypothetical protein
MYCVKRIIVNHTRGVEGNLIGKSYIGNAIILCNIIKLLLYMFLLISNDIRSRTFVNVLHIARVIMFHILVFF